MAQKRGGRTGRKTGDPRQEAGVSMEDLLPETASDDAVNTDPLGSAIPCEATANSDQQTHIACPVISRHKVRLAT